LAERRTPHPLHQARHRLVGPICPPADGQGDVDLTNAFVPRVEKAYVAHDPRHYHFFYSAATTPIGLYLDDTRYPYSLTVFRKAISRAIDREAISRRAEFGYAPPVDAIGINRIWSSWMDSRWTAEAKTLASYNPAAARRMLLTAGFTYKRKALFDPRGDRVSINAKVIASWSDWVTAWKIIAGNLSDIGIRVKVEAVPGWGAWRSDAFSTKVATLLLEQCRQRPDTRVVLRAEPRPRRFRPVRQER
jgi:peptide/nickel transport system substrate-binding protein